MQRSGLVGGVKADGERLGHGGLGHRHPLGDRNGLGRADRQALAEPALRVRKTHRAADELHVEAMLVHGPHGSSGRPGKACSG